MVVPRGNLTDSDVRLAVRLGSDLDDLLLACWIEARKLVDAHWPAILRVTQALQARGSLSGDTVEALWLGLPIAA